MPTYYYKNKPDLEITPGDKVQSRARPIITGYVADPLHYDYTLEGLPHPADVRVKLTAELDETGGYHEGDVIVMMPWDLNLVERP